MAIPSAQDGFIISLRGDVKQFNEAMSDAGQRVMDFARQLGPGGFAYGAVSSFFQTMTVKAVVFTVVGGQIAQFVTGAVRDFQRLEDQAVRSTFRIHQNLEQLAADIAYATSQTAAFLGPSEVIGGISGALQAGYTGWQSHETAFYGAHYGQLFGMTAEEGALELARQSRETGLSIPQLWTARNYHQTPKTADYYARRSGAAWEYASTYGWGKPISAVLSPLGDIFGDVRTWPDRISAEIAGLVQINSPQGIIDNITKLWRGLSGQGEPEDPADRLARLSGIAANRLVTGDYTGYFGRPISEVLAGRGAFDPNLAQFRRGLSVAGGADRRLLTTHFDQLQNMQEQQARVASVAAGADRALIEGPFQSSRVGRSLREMADDLNEARQRAATLRDNLGAAAQGAMGLAAATKFRSILGLSGMIRDAQADYGQHWGAAIRGFAQREGLVSTREGGAAALDTMFGAGTSALLSEQLDAIYSGGGGGGAGVPPSPQTAPVIVLSATDRINRDRDTAYAAGARP